MLGCVRSLAAATRVHAGAAHGGHAYMARWKIYTHYARIGQAAFPSSTFSDSKAVQQYLSAELAAQTGKQPSGSSGAQRLSPCLQHLVSTAPALVDDRCLAQLFRAAMIRQQRLSQQDVKSLEQLLESLSSTKPPKQVTALASIAYSINTLFQSRHVDAVNAGALLRPVLKAACSFQRNALSPESLPLRATSTLLLASMTCRIPAHALWAAVVPSLPARPTAEDLKPLCNCLYAASQASSGTRNSAAFDAAYVALVQTAAAAVRDIPLSSWPVHSTVALAASLVRPPKGHAAPPQGVAAAAQLLHSALERQHEASPALLTRAAVAECRLYSLWQGAFTAGAADSRPLLEAAAAAVAASASARDAPHLAAVLLHEAAGSHSAGAQDSVLSALHVLMGPLPAWLPGMSGRDLPLTLQALHSLQFLNAPVHEAQAVAATAVAALAAARPPLSPTSVLFSVRALAAVAPPSCLLSIAQMLQQAQTSIGKDAPTSQQLLLLHCASALGLASPPGGWVAAMGDALASLVREQNKSPELRTPRGVSSHELLVAAEGLLAVQEQRTAARLMRAATAGAGAPLGARLLPPPSAPVNTSSAQLLAHSAGALAACLPSDARLMAACTARALQALSTGGASPPPASQALAAVQALSLSALSDLVLGMCVTGTLSGRLRLSAHTSTQPVATAALARWLAERQAAASCDPSRAILAESLGCPAREVSERTPARFAAMAADFLDSMGLFQAAQQRDREQGGASVSPLQLASAVSVSTGDVLPLCAPSGKAGVFFVAEEDCTVPPGAQGLIVREAHARLLRRTPWPAAQQVQWLKQQVQSLCGDGAQAEGGGGVAALRLHGSLQRALEVHSSAQGSYPVLVFLQDAAPAHPRAVARLAALHAQGWTLLPVSCWEVAAAVNAGQVAQFGTGVRQELCSIAQGQEWGP